MKRLPTSEEAGDGEADDRLVLAHGVHAHVEADEEHGDSKPDQTNDCHRLGRPEPVW